MSIFLYSILVLFFLLILFLAMVAKYSNEDDVFFDMSTEEWTCPNCGFEVQIGDDCIYCGISKNEK